MEMFGNSNVNMGGSNVLIFQLIIMIISVTRYKVHQEFNGQ